MCISTNFVIYIKSSVCWIRINTGDLYEISVPAIKNEIKYEVQQFCQFRKDMILVNRIFSPCNILYMCYLPHD